MPVMVVIYFATRIVEVVYMGMIIIAVVDRDAATPTVKGVIVIMAIAITLQFYSGYILAVFCSRRRNCLTVPSSSTKTANKRSSISNNANMTEPPSPPVPYDDSDIIEEPSDSSDIEKFDVIVSPTSQSMSSSSSSSSPSNTILECRKSPRITAAAITVVSDFEESEYQNDDDDDDDDDDLNGCDGSSNSSTCTLDA